MAECRAMASRNGPHDKLELCKRRAAKEALASPVAHSRLSWSRFYYKHSTEKVKKNFGELQIPGT
jgi:hypothetical protein